MSDNDGQSDDIPSTVKQESLGIDTIDNTCVTITTDNIQVEAKFDINKTEERMKEKIVNHIARITKSKKVKNWNVLIVVTSLQD